MNTTIDLNLNEMYSFIQQSINNAAGEHVFKTAATTLYKIYTGASGRLLKHEIAKNNYYMTYAQWLQHFAVQDIKKGIDKGKPILSCILGFHGSGIQDNTCDTTNGLVENIYLGIIPLELREAIFTSFNQIANNT